MPVPRRLPLAAALILPLGLCACDPRDCLLGIANRDCAPVGSPAALFPQDDAICRGNGLVPGSRAYAVCRETKLHERSLTERATDFGALRTPLLPDIRPVVQAR